MKSRTYFRNAHRGNALVGVLALIAFLIVLYFLGAFFWSVISATLTWIISIIGAVFALLISPVGLVFIGLFLFAATFAALSKK